ncbi:MAG: zinc-binding dehydrogenase [Alphaproteobacteria bacterium]|nr:zinc-binding dehydrogenase [Alphaproteobacteria bacterium]
MRSYQITGWGQPLEPREAPTPTPIGSEVLLRVTGCGVCHSDIHIKVGYFDMGGGRRVRHEDHGTTLPFTMGHEIVGEVATLGPDARGVAIGDRRVVFPWIGCRACAKCEAGDELMCQQPKHLGAFAPGGYADHVLVPHPQYLIEFGTTPPALAATYACSGLTAYAALRKAGRLTAEDWLLVIGCGGVGLSAINLAKLVSPARVVAADIDPGKRQAALAAGATEAIDNGDKDAMRSLRKISGGGVAAAIDFVGAPKTSRFGVDALRKGGTHVVVGLYGDVLEVPLPYFPFKLMTIRGSLVGTLEEMRELMALVRAGKVPPIPIATRPLAEVNQVLDDLERGRVVGRVVVIP